MQNMQLVVATRSPALSTFLAPKALKEGKHSQPSRQAPLASALLVRPPLGTLLSWSYVSPFEWDWVPYLVTVLPFKQKAEIFSANKNFLYVV